MDLSLPDYLSALNELAPFAIVAAIIAGVWLALPRTSLARQDQTAVGTAITAALLAWFAAAWLLAHSNFFLTGDAGQPRIPYAIVVPIAAGLLLLMRSERTTALIDAVPQSWIVGVQFYRVLGGMFLLLWAMARMPAAFAVPAGSGDVMIGLAAPFVAWLNARRLPVADEATWWWNVLGISDLVIAVATGFLTAPSPYQGLAFDQPNYLILASPIVIVPAFLVPASIILHVLSLWKMRRTAIATASAH